MLFLRKLFKLPSPVELGWSEYNALPSRDFTPDCEGPTWEDWHVEVKKLHPVKYFIAETAGDFFRYKIWLRITRPFEDARYWFVSHFIPSRRYHMLDLRQPNYRYGWRDVPEKMLYAWFNLLGEYLDKEEPYDLTKDYTLEQIEADAGLKRQHHDLQEARAILHWWRVERLQEQKIQADLLDQWYQAHKDKAKRDDGTADKLHAVMRKAEEEMEEKTDNMLVRLMKIRRSLWT